ncbi:hypothetical protein CMQ_783 [Grosmannia clavigera kw1407]|uniref:Uncharacterized protein n=1 Tax=Grosmannia clavigera (strain kw1407 / UAMH 11150) TaxID=655863 RepID=F0XEP6_GROCL|nr:uncharacterized protein CMQ_783 [Grosmannia clavigera kw1407]EFX03855.1 hypothetical protein CMQ_783 [Grosmannia clavigera kw1407]
MLPEIVPLPPPSPQSAQSVVDSSDVERLADDLCRQHLEGQAMTGPDPTTAVDYDADSSWQHSVDLDLEVDDGISISSAAATPSLPPYRLRSMSSFASVPSQMPRAAVAAASTLPRSRQPARHHSYHHPPLPQTWIETTTCPQQEELQLQLQLQQQQQPRQLPPLLLPLSAASLALPQLAPTHRDVPSSGYDLCSWLDKTVGRGHVTGITLPTALSTMSTMPAELVPKTDGLEIDPDVDASSDADNSRDAAMCTEVAREIRMARLVRAAVTGQASGSKANPGPSPIPHDMASIAEDPDDDFLPMSLRMAGQPGGIRKVSFGLLHVRLSAAEIARRCPNLVYSRPRMRRRRPPGSGGAGGSSGGHRSFKAASRSPQPSAGSMAGEPDCEPPLALSTTLPSPALDLAADSMAVDFVEAAET